MYVTGEGMKELIELERELMDLAKEAGKRYIDTLEVAYQYRAYRDAAQRIRKILGYGLITEKGVFMYLIKSGRSYYKGEGLLMTSDIAEAKRLTKEEAEAVKLRLEGEGMFVERIDI